MRPFNLEKALAGEPVITRDKRKVTELYLFKTVNDSDQEPLHAVIDGDVSFFTESGRHNFKVDSDKDLFMAPKLITFWANVYETYEEHLFIQQEKFDTEEEAKNAIFNRYKFLKTIAITVEESHAN
jgi:hypothetical protein